MTPRPADRRVECTQADAKARLHDAVAFLEIADIATDAAACVRFATQLVDAARTRIQST